MITTPVKFHFSDEMDDAERRAIAEAEAAELAESTGAETHADEGAGEEA